MCLAKVTSLPSRESLLKDVEGWAVKREDGQSLFPHASASDPVGMPYLPAWGLARIRAVNTGYGSWRGPGPVYPSGFHIFLTKKDAVLYDDFVVCAAAEVVPVLGRGVLATGLTELRKYSSASISGSTFLETVVVLELEPRAESV